MPVSLVQGADYRACLSANPGALTTASASYSPAPKVACQANWFCLVAWADVPCLPVFVLSYLTRASA
jgi:hypothetical protein